MNEALILARQLVDLRLAAEAEVRAIQECQAGHMLTEFQKELIRTAFKGGAAWGVKEANKTHEAKPE